MNQNHFYSLDTYLKETFGEKVYRISLNGGMTCPNRDGTKGTRRLYLLQPRWPPVILLKIICLSVSEQIAPVKRNWQIKQNAANLSPIFRRIQTPMPLSLICARFFWKRSGIQTLLYYPSPQDRTVSMMKSSHCCPN